MPDPDRVAPHSVRPPSRRKAAGPEKAPARRTPLTREGIVAAALELVDRDGLADFSMRSLGAALGCEPMSIYYHFPSKAHLQDALVDHAIAAVDTDPPGADPIDRLRAMARSYRAVAHRHPKLFPLVAVHRLDTPAGARMIDGALALVRAAVPDDRRAAQFLRVLGWYLTGAALGETAGSAKGPSAAEPATGAYVNENCPRLAAALPYFGREWRDDTFDLGLEALLDAMRVASESVPRISIAPKPVIHPKR
jgi:AcrR family transcriptional regulator